MPDDKRGREKQARDADRRQRARAIAAELERMEETEPPVSPAALDDLETELDDVSFPASGAEVVSAVGDSTLASDEGLARVADLVPELEAETFAVPADVVARVQRPTIASAMKQIAEANAAVSNERLSDSQRKAYEKTLRALKAIDADDDDEGVRVISEWLVEQIRENGRPPDSRAVRRQAATFCRENGYEIRNDEWLGI